MLEHFPKALHILDQDSPSARDAALGAALRAERLVRLNALKLLAARGKLHAALSWIHDFCSSGERLVVFAHHRNSSRNACPSLWRSPAEMRGEGGGRSGRHA